MGQYQKKDGKTMIWEAPKPRDKGDICWRGKHAPWTKIDKNAFDEIWMMQTQNAKSSAANASRKEFPNRSIRSPQNERLMASQKPISFRRGNPDKNAWNQQGYLAERLRSAEDVKSTVMSQKIQAPPGLTLNSGSESSLSDLASTASS